MFFWGGEGAFGSCTCFKIIFKFKFILVDVAMATVQGKEDQNDLKKFSCQF